MTQTAEVGTRSVEQGPSERAHLISALTGSDRPPRVIPIQFIAVSDVTTRVNTLSNKHGDRTAELESLCLLPRLRM
jgi:hypothetical protein